MKVLYCQYGIALLLIGWSSAKPKKPQLDESKLRKHCQNRDVAYVQAEAAIFGAKAVVEAGKSGEHCLMEVVSRGQGWVMCPVGFWDPQKKEKKERCRNETEVLAEYLIHNGADVNEKTRKDSVLSAAAFWGNIQVMKMLLDAKADTEIRDYYGETPIFSARTRLAQLSLLIANGANVNAQNIKKRNDIA